MAVQWTSAAGCAVTGVLKYRLKGSSQFKPAVRAQASALPLASASNYSVAVYIGRVQGRAFNRGVEWVAVMTGLGPGVTYEYLVGVAEGAAESSQLFWFTQPADAVRSPLLLLLLQLFAASPTVCCFCSSSTPHMSIWMQLDGGPVTLLMVGCVGFANAPTLVQMQQHVSDGGIRGVLLLGDMVPNALPKVSTE